MDKSCSRCKELKDTSLFNRSKATKDGLQSICRSCHLLYDPDYKLRKAYGISKEEKNILLDNQGGRCKICSVLLDGSYHSLRPHVDHRHADGKVRGLLCGHCNFAIGLLRDDTDTLQRAIAYLQEY